MKEQEFAHRIRHHLNLGADGIDRATADRLFKARQNALEHQKVATSQLSLAGIGNIAADVMLPHARTVIALLGLMLGVAGVSYWNDYQQAAEYEEIDSALLADDLPINAYLDKGFHAWLDQPSSQQ
ncbi:MAG: DUF3619 domain-containing protein [Rhodocyclaceae bacterium]|jgi:hypothetical protein|nr:DUF3619 domain-containing protein [Rhodocyclaceae bacterium]